MVQQAAEAGRDMDEIKKRAGAPWLGVLGRISFQSRLSLAFVLLFVVGLAGLITSVVMVQRITHQFAQTHAAHHQLMGYLSLSNHVHRLSDAVADAVLSEPLVLPPTGAELLSAIRNDLAMIEAELRAHGAVTGDVAVPDRLKRIEEQVDRIERDYTEASAFLAEGREAEARSALSHSLDQGIDRDLAAYVDAGIAGQHQAVDELDGEAKAIALIKFVESTVFLQLLFTVPLIVLLGVHLRHRLRSSLSVLLSGTDAIAKGDLSHRVGPLNDAEFQRLGERFNNMAAELARHRRDLETANRTLEDKVAERTSALRDANARLEATDAARRRLFADVSHELRTPLTIMRGEAEVTLRGRDEPSDRYKDSLKRIIGKCGHMGGLVDDLLFMARSEAGEARYDMRTVPVAPLLEDVVRDFTPAAEEKGIALSIRPDAATACHITGDGGRLRQVFTIVMDNALRYCAQGDRIDLSVHGSESDITIVFEDTGPGIPESDMDGVFERFYRGGNTQGAGQDASLGAGLGLPVAKAIVEAHRGTITLTNGEQRGVRVTVRLPLAS